MKLIKGLLFKLPLAIAKMFGHVFYFFAGFAGKLFSFVSIPIARRLTKSKFASKIPFLNMMTDPDFDMVGMLENKYKNSKTPLLRGDLDTIRSQRYPKDKHPLLWKKIRKDMNPGGIIGSKDHNKEDLTYYAQRYYTKDLINKAYSDQSYKGLKDMIGIVLLFALFYSLSTVFFSYIEINLGPKNVLMYLMAEYGGEYIPTSDYKPLINYTFSFSPTSFLTKDYWNYGSYFMTLNLVWNTCLIFFMGAMQALLNPLIWAAAILTGILTQLSIGSKNLQNAVNKLAEPYLVTTKDEMITSRYYATDRKISEESLLNEVEGIEKRMKPKGLDGGILLGHSTGQMLARNADPYTCFPKGTPFAIGYEEMFGHFALMGNTGAGKTSLLFKRIVHGMSMVPNMGMMIIDYKADLPFTLTDSLKLRFPGVFDDRIKIVGVGPSDYGVDLAWGLKPSTLIDKIRSVVEQTEDTSGGDYFSNAAYMSLEHAARLAIAYGYTPEGIEWAKNNARRPYNIMFMIDMILRDDIAADVIAAIVKSMGSFTVSKSKAGMALVGEDLKALRDSIRYMGTYGTSTWLGMPERQKGGVIGTLQTITRAMNSDQTLRERFFEGRLGEKMLTIDEIIDNGYIVPVNVSTETEGMAGEMVVNMLETQLFSTVTRRATEFSKKDINPQTHCPFLLAIDEAQNFITGGKVSLSDSKVVNTARSAGLSLMYGFQNFSSLEKRVGEVTANDMLSNLTNRITLVNSNKPTQRFFSENFGKTLRMRTNLPNQYENFSQVCAEREHIPVEEVSERLNDEKFKSAIFTSIERSSPYVLIEAPKKQSAYQRNPMINELISMISSGSGGGMMAAAMGASGSSGDPNAKVSAYLQQTIRDEDKQEHALTSGNEFQELLPPDEISKLPQGHAVIESKVGNHVRKDIIKLLPGIYD